MRNVIATHDGGTVTITKDEVDRVLLALQSCGFTVFLEDDTTEECNISTVSLHVMDWSTETASKTTR